MIDPSKRYVTRAKRLPYTILKHDLNDVAGYPVVGYVTHPNGDQCSYVHTADGRFSARATVPHELDLVLAEGE